MELREPYGVHDYERLKQVQIEDIFMQVTIWKRVLHEASGKCAFSSSR